MFHIARKIALTTLATICLNSAARANAAYSFVDLSILGFNATPRDINNLNQVIGFAGNRSYLLTGSNLRQLNMYADAINDNGLIVGQAGWGQPMSFDSVRNFEVYWDGSSQLTDVSNNGTFTGHGAPTGTRQPLTGRLNMGVTYFDSGAGLAINKMGDIAGYSSTLNAVIWSSSGARIDLPSLGGLSFANDLNDLGIAVGVSNLGNNLSGHATRWTSATSVEDLGTLGGSNSMANAINNLGQVVGSSEISVNNQTRHAVLWQDGGILDLTNYIAPSLRASGWYAYDAVDINEGGVILGILRNAAGTEKAFLLSPVSAVPEPDAVVLAVVALVIIGRPSNKRLKAQRLSS